MIGLWRTPALFVSLKCHAHAAGEMLAFAGTRAPPFFSAAQAAVRYLFRMFRKHNMALRSRVHA